MAATECSTDLLMLLSEGLTEGRLAKLLRRWSKRGGQVGKAEHSTDAAMGSGDEESQRSHVAGDHDDL